MPLLESGLWAAYLSLEAMPYLVAAILVAAFGLARPSFAEEPTVTRATYDAYVGMFAMQQHLKSCERHAPAAVEQLRAEVASIRAANDAALRRLGPAADKWKLPGDRPIDEILAHIRESTDPTTRTPLLKSPFPAVRICWRPSWPLTNRWSARVRGNLPSSGVSARGAQR